MPHGLDDARRHRHGRKPSRHLPRRDDRAQRRRARRRSAASGSTAPTGNLEILDTDGGELDGDPLYDRAMGPMQFIPETWRLYGVDANNDGVISPDNIDDAALSAAGYLCWRGKDLAKPRGWMNALRAYNLSDQYARTVRDWATAYADGHPL